MINIKKINIKKKIDIAREFIEYGTMVVDAAQTCDAHFIATASNNRTNDTKFINVWNTRTFKKIRFYEECTEFLKISKCSNLIISCKNIDSSIVQPLNFIVLKSF